MRKVHCWALLVVFAAACGGGGGSRPTGFLDLQNESGNWRFGACGVQYSVCRPGDERTCRSGQIRPCQQESLELEVGTWEVRARGTSACQGEGRFTVEVPENDRTRLVLFCDACSSCGIF